ncbi:hypothetical protein CF326_g8332 [Tilletia indica]|nr:hypothetical protein CF326_g8332 [Tilletia indica]
MTISAQKMAPIRRTAEVLGQEVSPEGRRVAKGKFEAIERWEQCSSVTEVRSFLGIAGQARAWIPNYSIIVKPLTNLTRKGVAFEWGEEEQAAMDTIKEIVMQRTYLVELKYGEGMKPIKLGVDAGPKACGFWLGQDDEDGQVQVARYGSLPFDEREQAYSQAKRELYAVFRALKAFRHWIWGTNLIVLTDASYIKGMLANPELPNTAMVRWLAYIMLFDPEIVHVKAKDILLPMVQRGEERGIKLLQLLAADERVTYSVAAEDTSTSVLSEEHQIIFDFLTTGKKPQNATDYASNKSFLTKASRYFVTGGSLWRKGGLEDAGRLVVDCREEQERWMRLSHEEAGHKGVATTTRVLEQRFYWKGLSASVKEWIKTCDSCEGKRYLVVARDDLSGWVEAQALRQKTARAVARFLVEDVFTRHGLPLQITTDQGTEFKGVVDKLLTKYKVDITRTSIYNPRANGAVERGHSPLKEAIVHAARALDVPWPEVVGIACWVDRTAVRRQYGHSPFFLLHGYEPLLPLDLSTPALLGKYQNIGDDKEALASVIADRISSLGSHRFLLEMARKNTADDRARAAARRNVQDMLGEPSFAPGQLVLVRNFKDFNSKKVEVKLQDNWVGPYKVLWQNINGGVWLSTNEGKVLPSSIHPSHVKAYRPRIRPHLSAVRPQ